MLDRPGDTSNSSAFQPRGFLPGLSDVPPIARDDVAASVVAVLTAHLEREAMKCNERAVTFPRPLIRARSRHCPLPSDCLDRHLVGVGGEGSDVCLVAGEHGPARFSERHDNRVDG